MTMTSGTHDAIETDPQPETSSNRSVLRISVALFLIALLPRFAIMLSGESTYADQYWEISESILRNGNYRVLSDETNDSRFFDRERPTALRGPATPFFLAFCRFVFRDDLGKIRLLTVVLGSLVSVVVYLMGRNLESEKGGILAGLIWALYPPVFIISYRTFFSEPIAIYCSTLYLYLLTFERQSLKRSLLLGLVMGIGVLNRGEFLILIGLMSVYLLVVMRYSACHLALSILICSVLVAPWIVRNRVVFGAPILSTHIGFNLWIGNNPWTFGVFDNDFDAWGYDRQVELVPQLVLVSDRFPDLWDTDELTRSNYFKEITRQYMLDTAKSDPLKLISRFGLKFVFILTQPGELMPFVSQKFSWNPTPLTILPFAARLMLKIACAYFVITRKTAPREFLLLIPMVAMIVMQMIISPLPRFEVPYVLGCMLFVGIKLARRPRFSERFETCSTG